MQLIVKRIQQEFNKYQTGEKGVPVWNPNVLNYKKLAIVSAYGNLYTRQEDGGNSDPKVDNVGWKLTLLNDVVIKFEPSGVVPGKYNTSETITSISVDESGRVLQFSEPMEITPKWKNIIGRPVSILDTEILDVYTKDQIDHTIEKVYGGVTNEFNSLKLLADSAVLLKSITTSQADELKTKAPIINPIFQGTPKAPTVPTYDNSTSLATTAFVQNVVKGMMSGNAATATNVEWSGIKNIPSTIQGMGILNVYDKTIVDSKVDAKANKATTLAGYGITDAYTKMDIDDRILSVVGAAPVALDTLKELADALSKEDSAVAALTNIVSTKANIASPTFTGLPTAPTVSTIGNNLATTAFVQNYALNLVLPLTESAKRLQTAKTVTLSGDISASALFDGSDDLSLVSSLLPTGIVAGTYTKVTVDSKGRVQAGMNLSQTDIPSLDWSKITTGKPTTLVGYGIVDTYTKADIDAMQNAMSFLSLNDTPKSYIAGKTIRINDTGTGLTYTDTVMNYYMVGDVISSADLSGNSINFTTTLSNTGINPGYYTKVQVDAKGRIIGSDTLDAIDIPSLDWTKITMGKPTTLGGYGITDASSIDHTHNDLYSSIYHNHDTKYVPLTMLGTGSGVPTLDSNGIIKSQFLPSYVDDVLEYDSYATFPTAGEKGKIYVSLDFGKIYRWTGSTYVEISANSGTADMAVRLAVARVLGLSGDVNGSVSFDGSANASISTSLTDTGITPGYYSKVSVDAKGRVNGYAALAQADLPPLDWNKITYNKPTTLAGYGITDASTSNHNHDSAYSAINHTHANFANIDEVRTVIPSPGWYTFAFSPMGYAAFGEFEIYDVSNNRQNVLIAKISMNPTGGSINIIHSNRGNILTVSGLRIVINPVSGIYELQAMCISTPYELRVRMRNFNNSESIQHFTLMGLTFNQDLKLMIDATAMLGNEKGSISYSTKNMLLNGNYVWHSGNVGVGSGLDSDMLQGLKPTNAANGETIVSRDAMGNFSANTITASLSGNAISASKLSNARKVTFTGDLSGSYTFDGTADLSVTTSLSTSGVKAGTYRMVTVNDKGLVVAAGNPVSLDGYGIVDAYTKSEVDTKLASNLNTIKTVKVVEARDVVGILSMTPSILGDISLWTKFSHLSDNESSVISEADAFKFDITNNVVNFGATNSTTFAGILSDKFYEQYLIEMEIGSTEVDDDSIVFVIASAYDESKKLHTLSLVRHGGGVTTGNGKFALIYDYLKNTQQIIWSVDTGEARTNWNVGTSKVKVIRTSNGVIGLTTKIKSSTYMTGSAYSFNINFDNYETLKIFKGSRQIGFATYSQANSFFKLLKFTEYFDFYKLSNNRTTSYYTLDTTAVAFSEDTSINVDSFVGKQNIMINDVSGEMFYKNTNDTITKLGVISTYGVVAIQNRSSTVNTGNDDWTKNYALVYPPMNKTIRDLMGFIPSISQISFSGTVNGDDVMFCKWRVEGSAIRILCNNSENRDVAQINYLALWR